MALLSDSSSAKTTRRGKSKKRASSVPSFLPDSADLQLIESLKKELADAKANVEASTREIADLKEQLRVAQEALKAPAPEPAPMKDERPERQSFFGV